METSTNDPVSSRDLNTAYVLAGCSVAAGAIHLAMVPTHAGESLVDGLGFAVAAWFQIVVAALIITKRVNRAVLWSAVAGNAALIGLWVWSRTAGLPFGAESGVAEDAHALDVVTVILEAAVIVVALTLLYAPRSLRVPPLVSVIAGVSALALATVVMVSPDASEHGHGDGDDATLAGASSSHEHGGATTASHDGEMATVEAARCDRDINPEGYYTEAKFLGIDTLTGGAMEMDHAGSLTEAMRPTKLGGRGSEQLDKLVSLSTKGDSEAAAAALVAELSRSTDEEYTAWLEWMRETSGHMHSGSAAAPDDTQGHGGHMGPHPWTALIDQADCDRLRAELDLARKTAMKYPTAKDAEAGGWRRVTGYVPGIAAHYMNFSNVDGKFDIEKPEMLLYDGGGPDARMVGLSYYIVLEGEAEPTQGFTGANDHFHRHIGLCVDASGVIGDSTTTEEECAARGGQKQNGGAGWMNHTWIVPGCESPWGMFSGANPLLDVELSKTSGQNAGGCAASGVRDRYDLSTGATAESPPVTANAAGD